MTSELEHGARHAHAGGDGAPAPGTLNSMAASATLHCLTGCAIGEVSGLVIATAVGLGNASSIALSLLLAFVFGYTLSTTPLLRAGLGVGAAVGTVLAADTLSILTMEVVDNLVVALVPGALAAGLVDVLFWASTAGALLVAFVAAYPVNLALLRRGAGHALTHEYHHADASPTGWRRLLPDLPAPTLAAGIASFLLGGLVVAAAAQAGVATPGA